MTKTNALNQDTEQTSLIPAISVKMQGHYLIEASAGTGKTFTLTGIILRLLIEGKKAPEQIIATTFTRAAAAEMRKRIHDNLINFYQVCQWLENMNQQSINHTLLYPPNQFDTKAHKADFIQKREQWLKHKAEQSGMIELVNDPIYWHLLTFILDHEREASFSVLADTIRRLKLTLTTLDKLFVGTLDSLAQKWLREYSLETGYDKDIQISNNERLMIDDIIHDTLRQFYQKLPANTYQYLQRLNKLTDVGDYKFLIEKALNFYQAPIDDIDTIQFDMTQYHHALNHFKELDLAEVKPYFNKDHLKKCKLNQSKALIKNIGFIEEIQQAITQHDERFTEHLSEPAKKLLANVGKKDIANKGGEDEAEKFLSLSAIISLQEIFNNITKLDLYLENIQQQLTYDVVSTLRKKLPIILEEKKQITFSLQMQRLNQALSGQKGKKLAQTIRYQYPVALIDESQDMNAEQAQMIQSIYLNKPNNESKDKGFLLLVGDPKQAIYGFRGGDVENYNHMKQQFNPKNQLTLNVNRRSNQELIHSLNHFFGKPEAKSSNNEYSALGNNINYQYIEAHKQESALTWNYNTSSDTNLKSVSVFPKKSACLITMPYQLTQEMDNTADSVDGTDIHASTDDTSDNEKSEQTNSAAKENISKYQIIAWHIQMMLNSDHQYDKNFIQPSDISILAKGNDELHQMEIELNRLNIATLKNSITSVFSSDMAIELLILLESMLNPYHSSLTNRILMGKFYGISLERIKSLQNQSQNHNNTHQPHTKTNGLTTNPYHEYQQHIQKAGRLWQKRGILAGLQLLLGNSVIHQQENKLDSIWQYLATQPNGERYLVDLRHLIELIAQQSQSMGEIQLTLWLQQQINKEPQDEESLQRQLAQQQGVQLMTIHKSKGLEFPIVYVLGLDKGFPNLSRKDKASLYLYHQPNKANHQRLSVQSGTLENPNYYADLEKNASFDELKRLAYVAVTRTSDQLFLVVENKSTRVKKDEIPASIWLETEIKKEGKNSIIDFQLPKRLINDFDCIQAQDILTQMNANQLNHHNHLKNVQADIDQEDFIHYPKITEIMPQREFKGWIKTSFTALSNQIKPSQKFLVDMDIEDKEDDLDADTLSTLSELLVSDNLPLIDEQYKQKIQYTFIKGANAGSFLHKIFELIDFEKSDGWSKVIDKCQRDYQLPNRYASAGLQRQYLRQENQELASHLLTLEYDKQDLKKFDDIDETDHQSLQNWIKAVLSTPLLASKQPLQQIKKQDRLPELGFRMGLGDNFQPSSITSLFQQYLPNEPDKWVDLEDNPSQSLYRYLSGEIDLVYQYQNKYYIVDYKSNHLGEDMAAYSPHSLTKAMNKAGYWLQAIIYQVALHRFLSLKIADYKNNEQAYLGGVEYVFLRGIDDKTQKGYGRIFWQPPIELIKALDKAFSQ